jgi:hypothetical protein
MWREGFNKLELPLGHTALPNARTRLGPKLAVKAMRYAIVVASGGHSRDALGHKQRTCVNGGAHRADGEEPRQAA